MTTNPAILRALIVLLEDAHRRFLDQHLYHERSGFSRDNDAVQREAERIYGEPVRELRELLSK